MKQITLNRRKVTGRSRPRLEQLESRVLCAVVIDTAASLPNGSNNHGTVDSGSQLSSQPLGAFLTVVSSNPKPNTTVTAPKTITVMFDRPIDPSFFGNDLVLHRINDDGSVTSVFDSGPATSEALDRTGNGLVVSLNQTLSPGHYEFFLSGNTFLMGVDFSMLDSNGSDQLLGKFDVGTGGLYLKDATPLDPPGAVPSSVPGTLDLAANPNAVDLYKIVLPNTHFWQLGIEVSAERYGWPLDSALTLFSVDGTPIATDDLGRSDFLRDPYLFSGLPGGTYFIGVSGTGNLPGLPGGYNLLKGSAGSVPQSQAGGDYTLHVVANPADKPVALQMFTVDRADPLNATPTGLTLAFSGTVRTTSGTASMSTSLSQGIEVVDQTGRVWPVLAVGYSEANARVTYLFQDHLPAGHYTVRLPHKGGLVDLAGLSPVVHGELAGVLGSFNVSVGGTKHDPNDLGAILPGATPNGVSAYAALNPGDSVTYRFVVTYPDSYSIKALYAGRGLGVSITGPNGTHSVNPTKLNDQTTNPNFLTPGVYTVRLTNLGSLSFLVLFKVKGLSASPESLLENGVGQGAALNLRLIAPTVLATDVSPGLPGPTANPEAATESAVASHLSVSAANGFFATEWASMFFGDFVGRPSANSNRVSPVNRGVAVLASLSRKGRGGPGAGDLRTQRTFRSRGQGGNSVDLGYVNDDSLDGSATPKNGAMVAATFPGPTLGESPSLNISKAESLGSLQTPQPDSEIEVDAGTAAETQVAANLADDLMPESDGIQQAGLSAPIGAGLLAALVVHYRLKIGAWLNRTRDRFGAGTRRSRSSRTRRPHTGRPHRLFVKDRSVEHFV
jgi:methionine-rich copper-binding protein CopC